MMRRSKTQVNTSSPLKLDVLKKAQEKRLHSLNRVSPSWRSSKSAAPIKQFQASVQDDPFTDSNDHSSSVFVIRSSFPLKEGREPEEKGVGKKHALKGASIKDADDTEKNLKRAKTVSNQIEALSSKSQTAQQKLEPTSTPTAVVDNSTINAQFCLSNAKKSNSGDANSQTRKIEKEKEEENTQVIMKIKPVEKTGFESTQANDKTEEIDTSGENKELDTATFNDAHKLEVVQDTDETEYLTKQCIPTNYVDRGKIEQPNTQPENETQDNKDDDEDDDINEEVKEEIEHLYTTFPTLSHRYALLDRVGEGTFSTVYKAKDLTGMNRKMSGCPIWSSPVTKSKKHNIVALKRIYVTSSPQRIFNELQLLYNFTGCDNIAPLIDALRFEDQIIAVLPFYSHSDFRDFYRDLPLDGIKVYMHELFKALSFVHSKRVIHRDVKPTNFLYDPFRRRGVLVDFGLAEKEPNKFRDASLNCACTKGGVNVDDLPQSLRISQKGYLKDDQRSSRRANRAGTRGFRAPEVLFKCTNQTMKLDIWSVGIILLSLLSRRYPFFQCPNDVNALIELTRIFSLAKMKKCAQLHGLCLETNIPDVQHVSLGELIYWAIDFDNKTSVSAFAPDSPALELLEALNEDGSVKDTPLGKEYGDALELLKACFQLNPNKRITANDAMNMPFFDAIRGENEELDEIILD
ncbi:BA75_00875T0 [Komagataella pastoris]|uniref:non-specific serine/threonine protein kinase n=1 Tax=Komagataella pastoris TaxID=4922 RepID=A0A1B2J6L8_PICPA|nr:BA75_00875T0 [Komagataella pastoris]